jgi:hypothetical protein
VRTPRESNISEVSVARTADGNLHVVWTRPTPADPGNGVDLLQTPISPGGSIGSAVTLASNWATLANPAVVAAGGQNLDVFVGATRSINPAETIGNLAWFGSTNGGATWTLWPDDLTTTGSPAGSDTAAALGADNATPFIAWGSSSCLCVHRGVMQTPNSDFQAGLGNYGYEPGIAIDQATHQLVVAWYSNASAHHGMFAAPVNQLTGARLSNPVAMPGTTNLPDGPFAGRTQIAARAGGGLYMVSVGGYPSHKKVLLWRVGASRSTRIARTRSDVEGFGLAATPTGRIWVFWAAESSSDKPVVYAKRSNSSVSAWGATIKISPPAHATTSWNLVGNAQSSQLDLLGSFTVGSSESSWHTQVLPGLSLAASPSRLHVGKKAHKVTFTVTDAGAAVQGATVHVGSASGQSNATGKVTLALGPFKHKTRVHAHATRSGYVSASITLRVR